MRIVSLKLKKQISESESELEKSFKEGTIGDRIKWARINFILPSI